MKGTRSAVLVSMILGVAAARLVPHPPNLTPLGAMALFAGATFASRRAAFLVPLAALALSDLALGLAAGEPGRMLYPSMPVVYASFVAIVGIGRWVRRRRGAASIAAGTLAGSVSFFVTTNLGVWALGSLYPKTLEGLVACYLAAIPFFRSTLVGDAVYATALFGGLALAERLAPVLREARRPQGP